MDAPQILASLEIAEPASPLRGAQILCPIAIIFEQKSPTGDDFRSKLRGMDSNHDR